MLPTPCARLIEPRQRRDRCRWKPTAARRSRRRRLRNALVEEVGWLEVECKRCKTRASLPIDAIRRPRGTPIWKLEAALKCRSCKKGRSAPPVHMIKLTETRELPLTTGSILTRSADCVAALAGKARQERRFYRLLAAAYWRLQGLILADHLASQLGVQAEAVALCALGKFEEHATSQRGIVA